MGRVADALAVKFECLGKLVLLVDLIAKISESLRFGAIFVDEVEVSPCAPREVVGGGRGEVLLEDEAHAVLVRLQLGEQLAHRVNLQEGEYAIDSNRH